MTTLTNGDLADLLTVLLRNPDSGEMAEQAVFAQFCTDLAQVVCNYCGGDVEPAVALPQTSASYDLEDEFPRLYQMEVTPNESSPADGGVWNRIRQREVFAGNLTADGVFLRVEFVAPVGATIQQKDSAFLAALAQQVELDYLSIGMRHNPADKG